MLDKGPCGLKVLAKNKFKCKESLFNAVEKRIWELSNVKELTAISTAQMTEPRLAHGASVNSLPGESQFF